MVNFQSWSHLVMFYRRVHRQQLQNAELKKAEDKPKLNKIVELISEISLLKLQICHILYML